MTKFRFIGDEPSDVFGFSWVHGTEHEVTDAHAVKKLTNNCFFETVESTHSLPDTLTELVSSPAVLDDMQAPVEVPQMPRRRGPNRPKPASEAE